MAETAGVTIGGKKVSYKVLAIAGGALLGGLVLLNKGNGGEAGYSQAEGLNQRIDDLASMFGESLQDLKDYIDDNTSGPAITDPTSPSLPSYLGSSAGGGGGGGGGGNFGFLFEAPVTVGSSPSVSQTALPGVDKSITDAPKVKLPAPEKTRSDSEKNKQTKTLGGSGKTNVPVPVKSVSTGTVKTKSPVKTVTKPTSNAKSKSSGETVRRGGLISGL